MKGKLIVFEGIDGSGKNTQVIAVRDYLSQKNIKTIKIHFPLYTETFFGKEVGRFLNGDFGSLESVHPKLSSMLYAGDRFEKKDFLEKKLREGTFIICDRYVPSNIAHNVVRLPIEEHHSFEAWVETLEYKIFNLPQPDRIIFLDMSPAYAQELVLKKGARDYTQKKQDLHEENQVYLEAVYSKFKQLAQDREWSQVSCFNESGIRPIEAITQDLLLFMQELI